jgi:hypothetical protein
MSTEVDVRQQFGNVYSEPILENLGCTTTETVAQVTFHGLRLSHPRSERLPFNFDVPTRDHSL